MYSKWVVLSVTLYFKSFFKRLVLLDGLSQIPLGCQNTSRLNMLIRIKAYAYSWEAWK